jgi:hypothetical protein
MNARKRHPNVGVGRRETNRLTQGRYRHVSSSGTYGVPILHKRAAWALLSFLGNDSSHLKRRDRRKLIGRR